MNFERNLSRHINMKPSRKRQVWFPGTTQVRKGMGLCYDLDVAGTGTGETATDAWGRRGNSVAVPDTTNNLAFAGVASQTYPANSNGQFIDILQPGGMAEVAIGQPSTIYSQSAGSILTCSVNSADAGRFTLQGLPGAGSAIALETLATANGGDIAFSSLDGTATTSWSSPSLTITKTGIGTACGNGDSSIDPTEFVVVVLGGADDATGGDSSAGELATQGAYAVVTAPTADTITIATDIGDVDVTLYVIKNTYPTVLCYLMDGPESGLQQVLSPQDATAQQSMVGGTTFLCGGYTMAADSTATLADGIENGQLKAFCGLGTLTTKDWNLTVTSGVDVDATAMAQVLFDAAGEYLVAEWNGSFGGQTAGVWQARGTQGATIT
jgi:hypothetical protein